MRVIDIIELNENMFIYRIKDEQVLWLYNSKGSSRLFFYSQPLHIKLKAWIEKSGIEPKKLFNTSGILYREMQLKDKLSGMTDDEKLSLLSSNGMLVKRPLVVGEDFVLAGFREKQWSEIFS